MKRRDFMKNTAGIAVTLGLPGSSATRSASSDQPCREASFPKVETMTVGVADFVVNTQLSEITEETVELGKKSILDSLGLALSGSKAETAGLIEKYLQSLGCRWGGATMLGSGAKLPPRFAALANGIAIHVDDYDDTQLASAKDRVYGLRVHPTVCVLPAT